MQDDHQQYTKQEDLNREYATRAHDLNRQTTADLSKAAIESANLAIRSMTLINGGAVIALLAFISALETGDGSNAVRSDVLVKPLIYFALGVGFSAVTAALTYIVNVLDSEISQSFRLTFEHPYVVDDGTTPLNGIVRKCAYWSAFILGTGSLVMFFFGIFTIAGAIRGLGL